MKVFLTGATGLVGAHTALELLRHGHQLRLLVRDEQAARRYFLAHGYEVDDFVVSDMLDSVAVRRGMAGCDAVVHAAAVVDLDTRKADITRSTNVQGLENVVAAACAMGIGKIIYVSSISAIFHPDLPLLDESVAVAEARDAYSRSKQLCEMKVREWQLQGRPVIITYPSGVFGPDDPKSAQSTEGLLTMLNDVMPITSSGIQFVDARDVAIAHRLLLEAELANDKTAERYLVAGHFMRWRDFADLLDRYLPYKLRRLRVPGVLLRLAGTLMDYLRYIVPIQFPLSHESAMIVSRFPPADSSRLLQKTGMQFRPAQETLHDTVSWLQKNGKIKR